MEAFGLNSHIKAMTDRFASEGFIAISPNLFFREQDNVVAYDDLQGAYRLLSTVTGDQLVADMNIAIEHFKTLNEVTPKIGTTGFCMGGQVAFLTACRNSEISATVPFYGGGMVNSKHPGIRSPIEFVGGLKAPVLAFFGGRDAFISLAEVNEFREKLTALAGKPKWFCSRTPTTASCATSAHPFIPLTPKKLGKKRFIFSGLIWPTPKNGGESPERRTGSFTRRRADYSSDRCHLVGER